MSSAAAFLEVRAPIALWHGDASAMLRSCELLVEFFGTEKDRESFAASVELPGSFESAAAGVLSGEAPKGWCRA